MCMFLVAQPASAVIWCDPCRIIVRSKLQKSLESLRLMISQVRAALDWLSRPCGAVY